MNIEPTLSRSTVRIIYFFAILLTIMGFVAGSLFAASMFDEALGAYNSKNYSKAAEIFLREANRGNIRAQFSIGYMYDNGQGVPQDYNEAIKWYRLAADQGDAQAQNNLGVLYYSGHGIPQNYQEAAKLYRLAATQGIVQAQGNLGLMYLMGQGMPEDFVEAYAWFAVAAENGDENSRNNMELIIINMTPSQLEKAQELAKEYFTKTGK